MTCNSPLTIPERVPGTTKVWLVSLPQDANVRDLALQLTWTLAPINVTPFIALETTAGEGEARLTVCRVIKAALTGDVGDRRQQALAQVLNSKDAVLRYLVFLLSDPSYDALFTEMTGGAVEHWNTEPAGSVAADIALFEPLVRATGRDEDALARVASLVEQLRELPNGADLVPDGFEELWGAVWQAHRSLRR